MSKTALVPTLEDVRKGLIGKIGENMTFRRFKRFDGASKLASYLHGTRIGVVVEFEGDEAAAKDVAMHVAAMKPVVSVQLPRCPLSWLSVSALWRQPRLRRRSDRNRCRQACAIR